MWVYLLALLGLYFLFLWHRERQTIPNLPDKYVLITGCDSGFGSLLARQLDNRGLRVLAGCLTQKGAEQLKQTTSQRLQTILLDVSNRESVAAMAQWVKQQVEGKGLWGLVNNAGIGFPMGPNEWLTTDDFLKVMNVTLVGVIDATLSLLPLIRKSRGRIVNVSSCAGRLSLTGGGYSISKFGVEAFSDSLRRDMSSFGVKVSIIEPGAFKSSLANGLMAKKTLEEIWSKLSPEVKESYGVAFYQNFLKGIDSLLDSMSSKLSMVTDCMEHGLTAVYPRTRYTPGWDAKFYYIPVSYLPTTLADYILSRH